jgi:hypothetical protein
MVDGIEEELNEIVKNTSDTKEGYQLYEVSDADCYFETPIMLFI